MFFLYVKNKLFWAQQNLRGTAPDCPMATRLLHLRVLQTDAIRNFYYMKWLSLNCVNSEMVYLEMICMFTHRYRRRRRGCKQGWDPPAILRSDKNYFKHGKRIVSKLQSCFKNFFVNLIFLSLMGWKWHMIFTFVTWEKLKFENLWTSAFWSWTYFFRQNVVAPHIFDPLHRCTHSNIQLVHKLLSHEKSMLWLAWHKNGTPFFAACFRPSISFIKVWKEGYMRGMWNISQWLSAA